MARASPLLRCEFEHAWDRDVKDFAPVSEPYGVRAVNFDDNFRFKAVVMGDAHGVQYVNLYTYYYRNKKIPILLYQAKYLAPLVEAAYKPASLTGIQTVQSPEVGRQLQYNCSLFEVQP